MEENTNNMNVSMDDMNNDNVSRVNISEESMDERMNENMSMLFKMIKTEMDHIKSENDRNFNKINLKFDEVKAELEILNHKINSNNSNHNKNFIKMNLKIDEQVGEMKREFKTGLNEIRTEIKEQIDATIKDLREEVAETIDIRFEQSEKKIITMIETELVTMENKVESKSVMYDVEMDELRKELHDVKGASESSVDEIKKIITNNKDTNDKINNKVEKLEVKVGGYDKDIEKLKEIMTKCERENEEKIAQLVNQKVGNITQQVSDKLEINVNTSNNDENMLIDFSNRDREIHPMKFLQILKEYDKLNKEVWDIKFIKINKHFKGEAGAWLETHGNKWESFKRFERDFISRFWSQQKQEELRWRLMGPGNYNNQRNIGAYVLEYYNQVKYLQPEMPIEQFVTYITRHLPREYQVALTVSAIHNLEELETVLTRLQVLEGEMGKQSSNRRPEYNNNYYQNNNYEREIHYNNHRGRGHFNSNSGRGKGNNNGNYNSYNNNHRVQNYPPDTAGPSSERGRQEQQNLN